MKLYPSKLLIFSGVLMAHALLGQASDSALPNIVVKFRQTDPETTRQILTKKVASLESPTCNTNNPDQSQRTFDVPTSLEQSFGGRVKTIRVLRFVPMTNSSPSDFVRKVWKARFNTSYCYIAWAEGAMWSFDAEVVFEDGRRGVFITDGVHVALQDHAGKIWFLRLLPAAQ